MDDHSRNVPDTCYILQQLAVPAKESSMQEVMTSNAGLGDRLARAAALSDLAGVRTQMARRRLPLRPCERGTRDNLIVRAGESLVVRSNRAAPLGHRNGS